MLPKVSQRKIDPKKIFCLYRDGLLFVAHIIKETLNSSRFKFAESGNDYDQHVDNKNQSLLYKIIVNIVS